MAAHGIKGENTGAHVFTRILFVRIWAVIMPVALCLVVGAVLLSPAMSGSWLDHLTFGGGFIVGAVLVAALAVVPDILANRDHITVTGDAITFEDWADGSRVTMAHAEGDLLLVVPGYVDGRQSNGRRLTQLGTGRTIGVSWFFPKRAIWRACERSGWRFGYDPDLAERHLRRWRAWGWRASASSFIGLHGPFTMPDDPGGRLSLGAAILEEYGDWIIEAAREVAPSHVLVPAAGRDAARAYRRAASEQRAYAALPVTASERATRTAEADRLAARATEVGPPSYW